MKKSALTFKRYFENRLNIENEFSAQRLTNELFADFVEHTPIKLELLDLYVKTGHIDEFYQTLSDFKYLIEFSDGLNRYWYLLRAYSSALSRLKSNQTVKDSKKLYSYYFEKYGDRRLLRKEHWFEKKRWEFLDELQLIYREDELSEFIYKYQKVIGENLNIYASLLLDIIANFKKIDPGVKTISKVRSA